MSLINVGGLNKAFTLKGRKIKALTDVSFSVAEGESVGFIGQNGAGKSTSIKILFGALKADAGEALLMGRAASDPKSRVGVGYVPENPYLYEQLTPREVVSAGLRLHGITGAINTERTERWLSKLGIAYAADKRIRNLSKGMTQRTALAHAFAIEPKLLVLDEPMSGLDPVGRREVADLMQEYRQQGGTLFFSTHILHDVERLADRFVMIHKGQICAQQSMADMLASQNQFLVRYHGHIALEGFSADAAHIWRAECARSDLPDMISRIHAAGVVLIDAKPKSNLEDVFEGVVLN